MHIFYAALYYLISWPEEDDDMTVLASHKIVSPPAEEMVPGAMCKVKGFEKNPSKVVAAGSKDKMNTLLEKSTTRNSGEANEDGRNSTGQSRTTATS